MNFENTGISLDGIPSAEEVQWRPVEPGLKKVKLYGWAIWWVIIFMVSAAVMFFIPGLMQINIGMAVFAVLATLCWFHSFSIRKSLMYKAFSIREHDILYRTGWIFRSIKAIPFNRVQHCSVSAGVLGRKFEVRSNRLFTSGGFAADVLIPGLNPQTATDLQEWILNKIHQDGRAD